MCIAKILNPSSPEGGDVVRLLDELPRDGVEDIVATPERVYFVREKARLLVDPVTASRPFPVLACDAKAVRLVSHVNELLRGTYEYRELFLAVVKRGIRDGMAGDVEMILRNLQGKRARYSENEDAPVQERDLDLADRALHIASYLALAGYDRLLDRLGPSRKRLPEALVRPLMVRAPLLRAQIMVIDQSSAMKKDKPTQGVYQYPLNTVVFADSVAYQLEDSGPMIDSLFLHELSHASHDAASKPLTSAQTEGIAYFVQFFAEALSDPKPVRWDPNPMRCNRKPVWRDLPDTKENEKYAWEPKYLQIINQLLKRLPVEEEVRNFVVSRNRELRYRRLARSVLVDVLAGRKPRADRETLARIFIEDYASRRFLDGLRNEDYLVVSNPFDGPFGMLRPVVRGGSLTFERFQAKLPEDDRLVEETFRNHVRSLSLCSKVTPETVEGVKAVVDAAVLYFILRAKKDRSFRSGEFLSRIFFPLSAWEISVKRCDYDGIR